MGFKDYNLNCSWSLLNVFFTLKKILNCQSRKPVIQIRFHFTS